MKKSLLLLFVTTFLYAIVFSQRVIVTPKKYDRKKFELEMMKKPLSLKNDSVELKKQLPV